MKKIFSLFAAVLMAGSMMAGVLVEYNGTATLPAGVTISGSTALKNIKIHTNTDGVDCIQLANGYNASGVYNGNAIILHTEGGFKAGDTLKVAGFFNNSDNTKVAKAEIFTVDAANNCTAVWTSKQFINGRLVNDEPVLEAYVLAADMDSIMIGRNGATGANLKYIAVVRPEGAPVIEPVTVNVNYSAKGYGNSQEITKVDLDEVVSVTFDKGTNSNAPKYYTSGSAIRCYGSNTFTVSAKNAKLTNIALTFGTGDGANEISANVGTYADGVWTGETETVVFTIGGTTGNRRLAGMTVTYVENEIPAVGKPVFSIAAGSFYDAQTLELTCATEGASIYYTLDGTEPGASATLYTSAITISETTTVKAVAVKGAARSEVLTREYVIATQYASLAELISEAGAPASQKVVVTLTNEVVDSFYVSGGTYRNGVYLTVGDRAVEIYCVNVPAEWEVGGTISGVLKGEWKEWYGTWEVCPSSWEGIEYTAPLTFEVAKTAETITITPSNLEAPYYVAVLDPTYIAAWSMFSNAQKLAFHAGLVAGIESQAELAAASVTGVQTITLADYTTEGSYQVVAGAMHYDAADEAAINNFVIDSEVAFETFTVEAPAPAGLTFEVAQNGDEFTITPSNNTTEYYIWIFGEDEVAEMEEQGVTVQEVFGMYVAYAGPTDVFTGVVTQSLANDWYNDEPGKYYLCLVAVAAGEDDVYAAVGDITVEELTIAPAGATIEVVADNATRTLSAVPSDNEVVYMFYIAPTTGTYAANKEILLSYVEEDLSYVEGPSDITQGIAEQYYYVGTTVLNYDALVAYGTDLCALAVGIEWNGTAAVMCTEPTYITFTIPSTPTAVENVEAAKVAKTIENGQVVIIREGVRYNAVGAKL